MERVGAPFPAEQITLPAEPASAARAREFVRQLLRTSRHRALEDAAVLCVSELVTNVAVHTASRACIVTVVDEPGDLLIEVTDEARRMPHMDAVTRPETESGRGLRIVHALAGEWGVHDSCGPGKSVWLRLADD
jgi:anti-sigma regulatory factor (Ser/Thr protein kinase)